MTAEMSAWECSATVSLTAKEAIGDVTGSLKDKI
jgi:hypothetical protein